MPTPAPQALVKSEDGEERRAKQKRWRSHISRSFSLLDDVARASKVTEILTDAFNSWQFDAFALARLTENKPLSTLGVYLFEHLGLMEYFDLDSATVETFFVQIENGYDDANPYHNRAHAASVLHAMHALLEHGGIMEAAAQAFDGIESSTCRHGHLERMASLLAAAVHDFEHLGVSNDFLVRIGDQRAMTYNDQHVNENHHVAAAFAILSRPECNFVASLPHGDWRRLRSMVIELVLSTDMANGGKILKSFNDVFGVPPEGGIGGQSRPASTKDATLLLQMAIKCADLGHLALNWDVHQQWVSRLEAEFFAQGDQEKESGHSVSFLMDRNQPGCSKTQTGFFKFVVIPLFQSLVSVAPRAQPVLDAVMANYKGWQDAEAMSVEKGKEEENVGVKAKEKARRNACDDDYSQTTETVLAQIMARSSNLTTEPEEPEEAGRVNSKSSSNSESSRKSPKRSGRARQRAAKWWAAVRRNTPSPECSPHRIASSPL